MFNFEIKDAVQRFTRLNNVNDMLLFLDTRMLFVFDAPHINLFFPSDHNKVNEFVNVLVREFAKFSLGHNALMEFLLKSKKKGLTLNLQLNIELYRYDDSVHIISFDNVTIIENYLEEHSHISVEQVDSVKSVKCLSMWVK